jgi:decaprenylphospho-beta-D-ribofuranose 2-oxidase
MISGWGNYPRTEARLSAFCSLAELRTLLAGDTPLIGRGLGRSYGDSALAPTLLSTACWNRLRSFDADSGLLVGEAGVSLDDIIRVFMPRGWFPPVTPGTRFVTLGGALASDVHGKNHHCDGAFSAHVAWCRLMLADGSIVRCSAQENPELFRATVGGMGLTGIILEVALRLRRIESAWIRQHTRRLPDLSSVMQAFEEANDASYSVAWIDCLQQGGSLGRSVLMTGEHAPATAIAGLGQPRAPRALGVPCNLPGWTLNGLSVRAFNALYYRRAPRERTELADIYRFFYPLDAIHHWNRIYGRRGFVQYQLVLPPEQGRAGLPAILEAVAAAGQGCFLAVLKRMGPAGAGYLGFPREGWTLAMDFPARPGTFRLLDRLDRMVLECGGRLYLTKDARMPREVFEAGYPELDKFLAVKREVDPHNRFASLQSQRLGLT